MDSGSRQRIIEKAISTRALEEKLLTLFHEGKIFGTVHTCIGQEFTGAVASEFISKDDTVFSNHRGHGHFLSVVGNTRGLLAEILGRESGICRGLGGSQHLHQDRFFSNGIQGGMTGVAVGSAFAKKLQKQKGLSVIFIGDGTLGEGLVYESLNIASKFEVPVVFIVEDNEIAQSTPSHMTLAGTVQGRAEAFGIPYYEGNTWQWEELFNICQNAFHSVRNNSRPALLHIKTFRLKAHSKGDDTRASASIAEFEAKDPLNVVLRESQYQNIYHSKARELDQLAIEILKQGFSELESAAPAKPVQWISAKAPTEYYGRTLNAAILNWMRSDSKVVFLGEDVLSPYGGAFKIANNLSDEFPERVLTMPISEAAIIGLSSGFALEGMMPIAEIMFGDFLGLGFDQILNHAAKFKSMYNLKNFKTVIRTPMGGFRAYGPTHSQSIEKHFLGIPGTKVISANGFIPADSLIEGFKRDDAVFLYSENKRLYSLPLEELSPGFALWVSDETFPTAFLKPQSENIDVTIFCHGGITQECVEASKELFETHDVVAQLIVPSQIYPFRVSAYSDLVSKCQRVLVVEEGQGFAGFGAEVAAQFAEHFGSTGFSFRRCYADVGIIASSKELERKALPHLEKIVAACLEMMNE